MLKFIYGVMGSSKSAQALITEYNYRKIGYNVILLKPSTDTRSKNIESRIGLKAKCTLFKKEDDLREIELNWSYDKLSRTIVIVDEAQFCTKGQIEQLHYISRLVDVFCYGLKTNFQSELFEGSKRLLEIADSVEEIKHVCECGKPAIINARLLDGHVTKVGLEIQIGDEEYKPMCYDCWKNNKEI